MNDALRGRALILLVLASLAGPAFPSTALDTECSVLDPQQIPDTNPVGVPLNRPIELVAPHRGDVTRVYHVPLGYVFWWDAEEAVGTPARPPSIRSTPFYVAMPHRGFVKKFGHDIHVPVCDRPGMRSPERYAFMFYLVHPERGRPKDGRARNIYPGTVNLDLVERPPLGASADDFIRRHGLLALRRPDRTPRHHKEPDGFPVELTMECFEHSCELFACVSDDVPGIYVTFDPAVLAEWRTMLVTSLSLLEEWSASGASPWDDITATELRALLKDL